MNIIHR